MKQSHEAVAASLYILSAPFGLAFLGASFLTNPGEGATQSAITSFYIIGFALTLWPFLIPSVRKDFIEIFSESSNIETRSKSRRPDITADKGEIDFMLSNLRELEPAEFEHIVADLWSEIGWNTKVTSKSNDKGIDVIAKKKNPYPQKVLIQAKKYSKDNKVSSKEIQQYSSLKHQEDNVDEVIVVTTSKFTKNAIELASDLNVKLINGRKLKQMLNNNLAKEEKN